MALLLAQKPRPASPVSEYLYSFDTSRTSLCQVLVYGSTSGAYATAIQSARLGLQVTLVSPEKHIGGTQIEGLGATDIDNQSEFVNSTTVGGIALEFHQRISRHYGRSQRLTEVVAGKIQDPEVWRFESRIAQKVISDWLAEYPSIRIVHGHVSAEKPVIREGSKIRAIRLDDGSVLYAQTFVEASYEGDFLAAAGVSCYHGREPASRYNESLAGVRAETPYTQLNVDIDPYVVPGNPDSGLIYGISPEQYGQAGDGDKHLAAFSYRLPLTDDENNRVPITRPHDYDQARYELHRRYYRAGGRFYTPRVRIPGNKTDLIGSEAPLATDLLGMNDDWATGSQTVRRKILDETTSFTKGLLYFFISDECLPAKFRAEWSRFGYCRDEFPDNDHFPRMLYIRDARRMVSDYIITEHTASRDNGEPPVNDPIAVAYWPTDTHCVRRIIRDNKVHNEGFIFKDGHRWRPFGISYRALVPRRNEASNLITATCPSSSHVGYGAVRLEHQFHAIGQACANACDIALTKSIPMQDVPYTELEERLLAQGAVLDASTVGVPSFADE